MRLTGAVAKGWGAEEIWVSNDKYCSKFLHFKKNGVSSFHFHKEKHEYWRIMSGKFAVTYLDMTTGGRYTHNYKQFDVIEVEPMTAHRIVCIEEGTILEVSTPDSVEDNYRIEPGDSQKKEEK